LANSSVRRVSIDVIFTICLLPGALFIFVTSVCPAAVMEAYALL